MPSFRATLAIVAGVPRITVRFTVQSSQASVENRQALDAGANMDHAVSAVARTGALRVLRRSRGKWITLNQL
ncbi:hypothetical protein IV498_06430 [Paenarthrobacter sp. Z7-10]|uniref:hypothetical protein n=1 Tax=Paenarthrobacter sp. Z7-10 TaxID=2787635 RepID=UPI0022A8EACA|nr:hypothetical protein [Paenarthrobacter sp. Z7-10]MCZ2402828.1 hypothetical protein [Paenarthrobacter sp. Z7-10]